MCRVPPPQAVSYMSARGKAVIFFNRFVSQERKGATSNARESGRRAFARPCLSIFCLLRYADERHQRYARQGTDSLYIRGFPRSI